MEKMIDKICLLAQSKVRLIRFSFTYIAMAFNKQLLNQYHDLDSVICRLKAQPSLAREKDNIIKDCHKKIKEQLIVVSTEVIRERIYDPQEFIRRLVLENIAQLDLNEIKESSKIKETMLLDIIFESLRDESAQVRKLALNILTQILMKYGSKESLDVQILQKHLRK